MGNQNSWKRGGRLKTGEEITRKGTGRGERDKKDGAWGMEVGARGIFFPRLLFDAAIYDKFCGICNLMEKLFYKHTF